MTKTRTRALETAKTKGKTIRDSAQGAALDVGSALKTMGTELARRGKSTVQESGYNLVVNARLVKAGAAHVSDVAGTAARKTLQSAGANTRAAARGVGSIASAAAHSVGRTAKTIAVTALDQDGDGILSQNDVKIMTKKGLAAGKAGAEASLEAATEVAKSDLVKESAAAAVVGAAVAAPIPIIGVGTGALIGGAIGAYAHFRSKK